jgi:uncharacterized protein (TIGR02147 family)
VLKDRLGVKESVSPEDQAKFFSSWLYAAVHVLVSLPHCQTKEAIAEYLGISLKRAGEILEFLMSLGLVEQKPNGRYMMGVASVHLGQDSPMISKLHTNWRMKAIQSLERESPEDDIHYSSVVTISSADQELIKSKVVKFIAEIKAIVKPSKEEGIHSFCLDFFRI